MDVVDKFDVIETVTTGTLDVTMHARSRMDGRPVMLKRLRKRPALIDLELDRLQNEAFLLNRELGASIAGVTHVGACDGYVLMAAELCAGQSMRALVESASVDPEDVVVCLRHVAHTLDRAHEAGIVHGNLKPENVFFSVGEGAAIRVLDFGVVRSLERSHTRDRVTIGSAEYLPGYRLRGAAADAPGDRFALAVMAFEQLAGGRPVEGASVDQLERYLAPVISDPRARGELARLFSAELVADDQSMATCSELVARIARVLEGMTHAERLWRIPAACHAAKVSAHRISGALADDPTVTLRSDGPCTTVFVPSAAQQALGTTRRASSRKLMALLLGAALLGLGGGPLLRLLPAGATALTPSRSAATATAGATAPATATATAATRVEPAAASPETHRNDARRVAAGRLRVECERPVEVTVEGVVLGTTPLTLAGLPPGRYRAIFSDSALDVRQRRTLSVPQRGEEVFHVELEQGKLSIKGNDPVEVLVDDALVGTTPLSPLTLLEGEHSVALRAHGRIVRQKIRIEANTFHVLDAERELAGDSDEDG